MQYRLLVDKIKRNLNKGGLIKIIHLLARKSFGFFEKYLKLHITPVHFYSPIPDTTELNETVFEKIYDCKGIDWNLDIQFEYLENIFLPYQNEYTPVKNSGLSLVDAFVLYAMIRHRKPKVMIEVGGGDTTRISLDALRKNREGGNDFKFYSIEPFPREDLKELHDEDFTLIDKKLQDVDLELLSSADLLFIDSSHVSKINSDVNYEILEIIPNLKPGSFVHWHDIVIPSNYWKDWLTHGNMFWNESYMVHAFMLFNNAYKIIWSGRFLQLNYFEKLKNYFTYLQPNHRLMSFWIERQ